MSKVLAALGMVVIAVSLFLAIAKVVHASGCVHPHNCSYPNGHEQVCDCD